MAQKGEVTGKVADMEGEAVPYASVSLHRPSDSSMVNGMASEEGTGAFNIEVKPGTYYLQVRFLSYRTKFLDRIEVGSGKTEDLGTIVLEPRGTNTEEVEITGEKRRMEIDLDKRVFNVDKDLNTAGGNAKEVLNNTPSVNVDMEGNVSLRGSGGVRILINGRPSGMVQNGNIDALANLQGSMIKKVEVITNPSSRYDAEGEVGIINIVLKDRDKGGLNGSLNANAGWPHDHGGGFDLNYRKGLFNIFGSYGFEFSRIPGYGKSRQEFKDDSGEGEDFVYTSDEESIRGGTSHNARLGTDINFGEQHHLTLSGNMNLGNETNTTDIVYRDLDPEGNVVQRTDRDQVEKEVERNFSGNLNYERSFPDHKEHKWTVDAQYEKDGDHERADIEERISGAEEGTDQISDNLESEVNWVARTDYVHPFSEDGKWEAGLKTTNRVIENDYYVEERDPGESWARLDLFSNRFLYTERVNAAYGMIGEKFGNFSLQGGTRIEHTYIRTELLENDERNVQEYLNFFPSAHIGYELPNENTLQLSYSRRIDRPHFWDLIPFFNYSDPRSFRSGNPSLRPEYTNSYELGYLKYWKKGTFNSSLYYRHSTDVEEDITVVDSAGYTRNFPVNMATQNSYGLEVNASYNITPDWDLSTDLNFFRAVTDGSYEGRDLYAETYTMRGRFNSQIKLDGGWEGQLSYSYRAPRKTTQGRRLASHSLNFNVARKFLDKRARITLSARDIFNTRIRRWRTETENYYSEGEFRWHATRRFRLSFTYKLKGEKDGDHGERRTEGRDSG
jgi:outer membrane receptor protein involved in Fe transport